MKNNLYVDFHVLQTVPPSCINRDDTGSPKTAVFGGKIRARVSSQAWKHSIRKMLGELFSEEMLGYRTKNVRKLLTEKILEQDKAFNEEQASKLAESILESSGIKSGGDKKDVLFFISSKQISALAESGIKLSNDDKTKDKEKPKIYKELLNQNPGLDMVLFGRMAANDPNLNYDAAAQVAHAISTHAISNEYDYFTAVDDCAADDNAGAGHLGTIEFNSSTLYRYATVNIKELANNLEYEEIVEAVTGFTKAFIRSMPTGKQNTFANRTLPDMVYVTIRTDQPVNLVNAFEKAVAAGEKGYIENSKKILISYADELYHTWASEPEYSWIIGMTDDNISSVTYPEFLEELKDAVVGMLAQ